MKRSGRTLKQRLYGIKHLPSRIKRARYFRGHGVHSPYVYNIVRKVFMCSTLNGSDTRLYDALVERGVVRRRAMQLHNLALHCNYTDWAIDAPNAQYVILTLNTHADALAEFALRAHEQGATLCIISPYYTAERWRACCALIDEHPSTVVDNRGYVLLFNNHLPKQRLRL